MDYRYLRKNMSSWIPVGKKRRLDNRTKEILKSTFQVSIRSTLFIGQILSLIPVVGIFSNNVDDVRFVLTSWKCIYSLFSLLGQILVTVMSIISIFNSNVILPAISHVIFYGNACITIVIFFQVAKAWPKLVQHIAHIDELDPSYDKTLTMKCNVTCAISLFLSLAEVILLLFLQIAAGSVCFPKYSLYNGFFRYTYPELMNLTRFSPVLDFIAQFLHIQAAFIWNYSGLFVICISYYLTLRLNHVNNKLLAAQGKYLPEVFWRDRREDYGKATQLVRKFDEVISGIVFITFATNLFFICYQLFNSLETTLYGSQEVLVFHSFSLVYRIVKCIAVTLIASEVNSASKVPALVLYDIPYPVYGVEVQRFLDQVNDDKVALSGLQFFSITRGLLLNIAGTIITYGLVMYQFDSSNSLDNSTLTSINFRTNST